jgi:hypothetical protein
MLPPFNPSKLEAVLHYRADIKMTIGAEAKSNLQFCPWKMVVTYPDLFIGKANRPKVSAVTVGCKKFEYPYAYGSPKQRQGHPEAARTVAHISYRGCI